MRHFVYLISTVLALASYGQKANNEVRPTQTRKFDLIHTDLKLRPNWNEHQMQGEAMLTLMPIFYNQTELTLDARAFDISEVKIGKARTTAQYNYTGQKLIIFLDKTYTRKDTLLVYIKYVANPDSIKEDKKAAIYSDKGLYFINTDGKKANTPKHLWTQGETRANSGWFPTIDMPAEKHTQRLTVTYDEPMVSLSNGKLISSKKNTDGTKTDIWDQNKPASVYLTVLVIGEYTVVKDKWRDKEVSYYMEPKYADVARPIFGRTPEMIEFFSKKLGVDFPWDKYSQVIVHEFVSGAMENTTAVTFNTMFQKDKRELVDENDDETIAHELFHHWFGDLVTCEDWAHLTLNESFANYSEYLWNEHKYGMDAAQAHWVSDLGGYLGSARTKTEPLVRFDYKDPDDMFDVVTYQKGGKILHMLRKYVGDEAFFASLQLYLKRYSYKTAEYSDLRQALEEVTGEDLKWFFDQWYLKGGHPQITTSHRVSGDSLIIKVAQKHSFDSTFLYKIPFDVKLYSDEKIWTKRIWLNKSVDSFIISAPGYQSHVLDGENMLVGTKSESKTIKEWLYILNHSEQLLDQRSVLKKLANKKSKQEVKDAIYDQLSSDKDRIVETAIKMIDADWLSKGAKWNEKLSEIAQRNKRGATRAAALEKLGENDKLERWKDLVTQKLDDSSYLVEQAAFDMYAQIDTAGAYERAKRNVRSNSYDMLASVFKILGANNDPENLKYFEEGIANARGYKKLAIYTMLGRFISNLDDTHYRPQYESMKLLMNSKQQENIYSGRYALNALKESLGKLEDDRSKKRLEEVSEFMKTVKKDEKEED